MKTSDIDVVAGVLGLLRDYGKRLARDFNISLGNASEVEFDYDILIIAIDIGRLSMQNIILFHFNCLFRENQSS